MGMLSIVGAHGEGAGKAFFFFGQKDPGTQGEEREERDGRKLRPVAPPVIDIFACSADLRPRRACLTVPGRAMAVLRPMGVSPDVW